MTTSVLDFRCKLNNYRILVNFWARRSWQCLSEVKKICVFGIFGRVSFFCNSFVSSRPEMVVKIDSHFNNILIPIRLFLILLQSANNLLFISRQLINDGKNFYLWGSFSFSFSHGHFPKYFAHKENCTYQVLFVIFINQTSISKKQ